MDLLHLQPDQIIAMVDYPPLHCPEALEKYFHRFRADAQDISPVPVMDKNMVLDAFRRQEDRFASYRRELEGFLADHPPAAYFMLEGFHRSAAAVLARRPVPCIAITDDGDFEEINASNRAIQLHGDYTTIMGDMVSVDEELQALEGHFHEHRRFWTIEEKVATMIANGDVPDAVRRISE
jgi:hypothetical protein